MRLLGFINVFKLNPTFLQPVFWNGKSNKAYFQHSEDKMTISSFEPADLNYYIENADFIAYPETDVLVQTGSTVIFSIYMDKHIFWGDYLDILNIIKVFIDNKDSFVDFPGFYNTCIHFLETYRTKVLPDVKISKAVENKIIKSLFDFCSYDELDRTDFIDLYFQRKEVPKLWTIRIIKDLVFSMVRVRKTEEYIYSLLDKYWGLDLSQPLTPFKKELNAYEGLEYLDVDSIITDIINYNNISHLFTLDFLTISIGYVLIAENYLTKEKRFIATRSCNERRIYQLFSELTNELLSSEKEKLYLVINSSKIEKNAFCINFFSVNSDRIQVVEFPTGYRIEKRFK